MTLRLTENSLATLKDRYLAEGETPHDLFSRVAGAYASDPLHRTRLIRAMTQCWFMPSTPILFNAGRGRGFPISCFLNESGDSLESIADLWQENMWLAARGGGIGSYWGNLRSIGQKVGEVGKTSGVIPFMKVMDSQTLAISQGSLRRGSAAVYLPVSHPEIEEFIELRRPTGGDANRRCLNLHNGVCIDNFFMAAVEADEGYDLIDPGTKEVVKTVKARDLWIRLLTARLETGEPYLFFTNTANTYKHQAQHKLGLDIKTSNLCSEITLPTGIDHKGKERTAVCCLGSLNLETYHEWKPKQEQLVYDILGFLDNVLTDFIKRAKNARGFERAAYSAMRERSVGLGVMGLHGYYQSIGLPFDSLAATRINGEIFRELRASADNASIELGRERGSCPDMKDAKFKERFSNKLAIAPTATISTICGEATPGIDPMVGNSFTHKTLSGTRIVRNKYLVEVLKAKKMNTEEVWDSIAKSQGSVQHLDFLSRDEKGTFKTAFEIDPYAIIDQAGIRARYICQSQSLNLFLPANISKKDLHLLHFRAWQKGVKSLYYVRSKAARRAEVVQKIGVPADNGECTVCQ